MKIKNLEKLQERRKDFLEGKQLEHLSDYKEAKEYFDLISQKIMSGEAKRVNTDFSEREAYTGEFAEYYFSILRNFLREINYDVNRIESDYYDEFFLYCSNCGKSFDVKKDKFYQSSFYKNVFVLCPECAVDDVTAKELFKFLRDKYSYKNLEDIVKRDGLLCVLSHFGLLDKFLKPEEEREEEKEIVSNEKVVVDSDYKGVDRYEYKIVEFKSANTTEECSKELNELGMNGWEMCSFDERSDFIGSKGGKTLIFKRKIIGE